MYTVSHHMDDPATALEELRVILWRFALSIPLPPSSDVLASVAAAVRSAWQSVEWKCDDKTVTFDCYH